MSNPKIIVLGGGLSGLAAAEILSKNFQVTLFEASSYLGGLAANFEKRGRFIPRYYHHIIKSNKITQKYLWNFGKVKELKWKRIKVAIGVNNKIYTINNPLDLLEFRYLNFYEKMRFGLFGLYTLFLMDPNNIPEHLDAEAWLNKSVGKSVTKKVFHHLYSRNKFNIPLSHISAKQFAHRLHEKEVYDYFSFPKGGYQSMIDGLNSQIINNGGEIKLNSKITKIDLTEKFVIKNGRKINYDLLVSSIPLPEFIKLSTGLPKECKSNWEKIKYCPAVGICFATENFLNKQNYWINLFGERIHTLFQHSLLNDEYGEKINWCLRYGGSEEDLQLSDDRIKKEYLNTVKKYFPDAKIIWAKVFKTKYAEPIYGSDYPKYMPNYKTLVKGLYFTGVQLTHPKIRNMNTALSSGIKTAEIVLKEYSFSQPL